MAASVVASVLDVDVVYATAKSLTISSLSPSSGDLLIAWIALQQSVSITSVTGSGTWTELYSAPDTEMGSGVYYKISDGTETTITWNVSANSPASKGCLKITGHDATTPIEGSNKQYNADVAYGGTNSYTASATGLALALICIDRNQQNFGDPSSFSNSFTGQGGSSDASNTYTRVYYASKAYTSGSQSTTYTGTGAESNVGYLVLVKDAGGGAISITCSSPATKSWNLPSAVVGLGIPISCASAKTKSWNLPAAEVQLGTGISCASAATKSWSVPAAVVDVPINIICGSPSTKAWAIDPAILSAAIDISCASPATKSWTAPAAEVTLTLGTEINANVITKSWNAPAAEVTLGTAINIVCSSPATKSWNLPSAVVALGTDINANVVTKSWNSPAASISMGTGIDASVITKSWNAPSAVVISEVALNPNPVTKSWNTPAAVVTVPVNIVCTSPSTKSWNAPNAVVTLDTGIAIECALPATISWNLPKATIAGEIGATPDKDVLSPILSDIITPLIKDSIF